MKVAYYFENSLIDLDKTALYYKVFDTLYSISSGDGGLALYKDLVLGARKIDHMRKKLPDKEVIKFIQDNLTGNQNGFLKKAKLDFMVGLLLKQLMVMILPRSSQP